MNQGHQKIRNRAVRDGREGLRVERGGGGGLLHGAIRPIIVHNKDIERVLKRSVL